MIVANNAPVVRKHGLAMGGQKRMYLYDPQPDITVAELAEVVSFLPCGIMVVIQAIPPQAVDVVFDSMSEGAKRHFQVKELSSIVVPRGANGG